MQEVLDKGGALCNVPVRGDCQNNKRSTSGVNSATTRRMMSTTILNVTSPLCGLKQGLSMMMTKNDGASYYRNSRGANLIAALPNRLHGAMSV